VTNKIPRRSSLATLTRAVAEICRTEDDVTAHAAVLVMLRAYDEADHEAGRVCMTPGCQTCITKKEQL